MGFEFALLIPLAPFALGALWMWTRHQSNMADKKLELAEKGGSADPDAEHMREEMKYLKDRVAVLEQIVTDGHSTKQLENEIRQLKDQ